MNEQVVISGERRTSVAALSLRAAKLAAGLRSLGVSPGDRYVIVMRNETGFLEATLAASIIGAVPVPVNWHWTGADLEHLLHDCGAKVAIVHADLVAGVVGRKPPGMQVVVAPVSPELLPRDSVPAEPALFDYLTTEELIAQFEPTDPMTLAPSMAVIYTSGTTGLAKGVLRDPLDPSKIPAVLELMSGLFAFEPGGVTLVPAPLYHAAPNSATTMALLAGLSVVLMPKFDPEEFLRAIEVHKVTTVQVVPTMLVRLLRLPAEVRNSYDISSLRHLVHVAAPCPHHVKRAAIEWLGPIVNEYYGGSEGGTWTYCTTDEWLAHPGTVGKPVQDAAIKVLDGDMREVAVGQVGTVYGRPPSSFPNFTYIGDDEKRRAIDAGDGFITLGDVGHVDAEGYLYLSDRLNDMVISGGVNIYPAEIESSILQLDGVADVAVFGIPDDDLGEVVAAHVELLPGANVTAEDVKEHVRHNLARYKTPAVVAFDDKLPREDSGKLFKRRLKDRYAQPSKAEK